MSTATLTPIAPGQHLKDALSHVLETIVSALACGVQAIVAHQRKGAETRLTGPDVDVMRLYYRYSRELQELADRGRKQVALTSGRTEPSTAKSAKLLEPPEEAQAEEPVPPRGEERLTPRKKQDLAELFKELSELREDIQELDDEITRGEVGAAVESESAIQHPDSKEASLDSRLRGDEGIADPSPLNRHQRRKCAKLKRKK